MSRQSRGAELHYYSEAVRRKFGDLPLNAVTIVEAPSGYGKTTAVQDFLGPKISRKIPVYWFTATEEASEAGFRRLCSEIHKIDSHAGERLLKTGVPNAATIGEACDALRSIRCAQETYLVIDNLHLMQTALAPPFFTALMDHGGEGLHVVMITQMLGRDLYASVAGRGFLHISASDLRLDAGNIQSYYALSGAVFLAEGRRQGIVQMGATLQLAQVALYNADTQRWQHAINAMERAASYPLQNTFVVRSALDIMRGILLAELQQLDSIAGWLRKGDFSRQHLLPQMLPLALLVHGLYLLLRGEVPRMIGVMEARLPEGGLKTPCNYMLVTLNMAAGYVSTGNREKALSLVRGAAQAVMPDGIVFNFASFSWLLDGITDALVKKEYPEHFARMMEVKEFFGLGWNRLYHDILPKTLPDDLTEREREVELLAADGSRNKEIADKLCISESTVRTHMRTIFKKLDIDRRVKVAARLKSYR